MNTTIITSLRLQAAVRHLCHQWRRMLPDAKRESLIFRSHILKAGFFGKMEKILKMIVE